MARGFELAPADGGPRVALSPGETVIGRGPLLGITDKRISKRHAILELVDDQLKIKPIHVNPCFYRSSEKSQLLPLETNKWQWLNPGDSFSLLIDKYIFHVFSTHSETECTLRSQMLDEDDSFPSELPSHCTKNTNLSQFSKLEETTKVAMPVTVSQNNWLFPEKYRNSSEQPNSGQRKRILPAWMIQGDLSVQNLEVPFAQEDDGITKGRVNVLPTSSKRKKSLSSSGNSENIETEQDLRKECRVTDQEYSISSSKEMNESLVVNKTKMTKAKTKKSEIPEEQINKNLQDEDHEHRTSPRNKRNKMDEYDKYGSIEDSGNLKSHHNNLFQNKDLKFDPELSSDPETSSSIKSIAVPQDYEDNHPRRIPCIYGASCYRKNPVHFQQFSHPGDRDYGDAQIMNQNEDDNRPECPYGASCYRKNPQHKIEYKHSIIPSEMKTKRSRHKATKKGVSVLDEDSDNDGQPNDYDLNDSFLDDEEEEYEPTDEDSDWEPASEDQEGEDVEELLKEAKRFMKKSK
ncbi:aprataxin and PNK-like factor isoform X2 [Sminthopsis crassicaudata]|uniref:aprataxin and PNK-like factor isoform X2 n=1 Tax=Sminthopsis crassicaudata TaxID=9301 RepID=UPI003D68B342